MLLLILILRLIQCGTNNSLENNPIMDIAFSKNSEQEGYEIEIFLKREINTDVIFITGTETPEDENSYTVVKVVDIKSDSEEMKNTIHIPLKGSDLKLKEKTYSIQINERGHIYHTEPFKFDCEDCRYKLSREIKKKNCWGKFRYIIIGVILFMVIVIALLSIVVYKFYS
ncbi:hypothetical protein THOM_1343 [Trachipleistophora hominis]|uniref:Uncharacterized protein n=1 Tax=Trachipleistophora hominis TaxID=72359 RepID=L7JXC0_TRAHO|nr:hypothetical protein THOM_1343 [Trachipleistophora hominis]